MESRAGPHFQELLFLSLSNKKKVARRRPNEDN
jgi:hypothetical protein